MTALARSRPAEDPTPASLPPTRWAVVLLVLAAGILAALHAGKVPAALPAIREQLGSGMVMAGWIQSIITATGALGGMFAGLVADRFGARRAVLAGLAFLIAGGVLGAAAPDAAVLLVARFIEGVGFVATAASAPALVAQATHPAQRKFVMAAWGIYMPTGFAIALMATPWAVGTVGWRGLWLGIALVVALFLPALWRATRVLPASRGSGLGLGDVAATLRRPGAWAMSLSFMVYAIGWVALMAWLPTFLVEQRAMSLTAAAAVTAVIVIANAVGCLGGGWLLHRGVVRWQMLAVAFVFLGFAAQTIFGDGLSDTPRFLLCIAYSLVGGVIPAALFEGVPAHAPSPRQIGTINGMLVQLANVGSMLGPPMAATMVIMFGTWQAAGWAVAAFAGIGLGLALAIGAIERRR